MHWIALFSLMVAADFSARLLYDALARRFPRGPAASFRRKGPATIAFSRKPGAAHGEGEWVEPAAPAEPRCPCRGCSPELYGGVTRGRPVADGAEPR